MILVDEVANYEWISVDEVGNWLAEDSRRQNNNTISMEDEYLSSKEMTVRIRETFVIKLSYHCMRQDWLICSNKGGFY